MLFSGEHLMTGPVLTPEQAGCPRQADLGAFLAILGAGAEGNFSG
jgi:hypothetical protein